MKLHRLSVQSVRNHTSFSCDFDERTTVIYGKNGAGKTALLEAIAIVYRGVSFRGSDKDILRDDAKWYRIDVIDDTKRPRRVFYDNRRERPIKQFIIDDKTHGRLPQKDKYPIVLFTPNDLRLIDGSPTRRRDYLDAVITQCDPHYGMMRRRYERALLQRNKLLKLPHLQPEQLFSWNVILSETGAYMIEARIAYITRINAGLTDHYRRIAKTTDVITAEYTHPHVTSQQLLSHYETATARDLATGNTSVGPHRHDLVISMRGKPAIDTASRGELRTIILAIKFIEAELLEEYCGDTPLILLDDVYGELDETRRESLSKNLSHHQIIITSTDPIKGAPRHGNVALQ